MVDMKKKIASKEKKETERATRLEAALRTNLQRRKKQTNFMHDDIKSTEEFD